MKDKHLLVTSARIHSEYSTKKLSKKTWPDFEQLFRKRGTGDGWWCWCKYHHQISYSTADTNQPRTRAAISVVNRRGKKSLVDKGQAHGILVYDNGEPVGWCQYGLKEELPRIDNRQKCRKLVTQDTTSNKIWRITCFAVEKNHRRRGVASTALKAALESVKKNGGGLVEAYPVSKTHQGLNYLYSGTVVMFEKASLKTVAPLAEGRTTTVVMRRTV